MKQRSLSKAIVAIALFTHCTHVQAHYLWVLVEPNPNEAPAANIYFEESPKAGDGHYLDHFLGSSDVWLRTLSDPTPNPVKAAEVKQGKNRWMRISLPEADEFSVDTYGKFGVYEYGKTKVLLHYYARTIAATSHDAIHELGRAEQLKLDLVPHDSSEGLAVTLLWKGKPVSGRMVFIRGPKGFRKNVNTDEHGRVVIDSQRAGSYTFRSSVEQPISGEENGERYETIRHNITLLLKLPLEGQ